VYKKILVPLDGSERAEKILTHVENLARRYGATIVFLHVIGPVPLTLRLETSYVILQEELERQVKRAKSYLAALQRDFHEKGIETRTCINQGPVVDAIIQAAEREGADLIAIASHGRSGLSQVFYGSVAAGVLHRADRPLLLIRSREGE
jgi:nucleotide-binding universal stress UspA family protein